MKPALLLAAACALAAPGVALAQTTTTVIDRSMTSNTTTAGVNLPTPTSSYGQDEVQAAGGVACRSAIGGSGPYVDAGVVGSQDPYARSSATAYARVVVPLGRAPKRLDCTRLYDLEIQRLKLELELARMSLPGPRNTTSVSQPPAYIQEARAD